MTDQAKTSKLNDAQACRLFGVTPMTLRHWRQGTPRRTALPHVTDKTGKRSYLVTKLDKWAASNGIQMKCTVEQAVNESAAVQDKKVAVTATGTPSKKQSVVGTKKAVQTAVAKKTATPKPEKAAIKAAEAPQKTAAA